MSSFCICKSYSHFFSKNTCELDIVLTRTVNILITNELVKLTTLWTTGPGQHIMPLLSCGRVYIAQDEGYPHNIFSYFSKNKTTTHVVGTHQKCFAEMLLRSTHHVCFFWEIRKISTLFVVKELWRLSSPTWPKIRAKIWAILAKKLGLFLQTFRAIYTKF